MSKQKFLEALQIFLIIVISFLILIPILWTATGAFKHQVDIFALKIFFTPTLDNFREIFQSPYLIQEKMMNSFFISGMSVLLTIPLALLSAYSFSRFRLFAGKYLFLIVLATQFVPAVVVVLPFFTLFRDLQILDTKFALVLINLTLTMPFGIWMLKSFIENIPIEIEEAAMIDGLSRLQIIKGIVAPLCFPGIITTGIFLFMMCWNEFLFALILTDQENVTLPVGLSLFAGEEGILWNLVSAAGVLIMTPMFIFALIIQKHLVKGMNMGAIK